MQGIENSGVKTPQNILIKMIFGSHLYGTSGPKSDRDYMGVFLEEPSRVMLGKTRTTIQQKTGDDHSRNTKDDVDTVYKELQKFLYDAMSGQTYALDMLFAPEEFWIPPVMRTWKEIRYERKRLLSKNVAPFIGYCRKQAGKYGLKGSRLGELERVIAILEMAPPKAALTDVLINQTEFVKWVEKGGVNFLEVLNKMFDRKRHVAGVLEELKRMHDKYGSRSKEALKNNGVDWKAISHAYRCMYQLQELFLTGGIVFPLKDAAYLRDIKNELVSYDRVQDELPELMDNAMNTPTNLPEKPDHKFWDDFIVRIRFEGML